MFEIQIPKPIQIVIDDVGWWNGKDDHKIGQPFRTGINRNHVYEDYVSIIKLGESLGVHPQAAMILCEWDRTNILCDLPDSTWMGKSWDNSGISREQLDRVADYLNSNREYFEFTLHGIGCYSPRSQLVRGLRRQFAAHSTKREPSPSAAQCSHTAPSPRIRIPRVSAIRESLRLPRSQFDRQQ